MKQKCSVLLALLAIVCIVLTGCGGGEEAAAMEVAERFLQECFTLNRDGRYDVMEQKLSEVMPQAENQGIQTLPEEITQHYYAPLAEMTTAACLEDMTANRIPGRLDQMVTKAGLSAQIESMELEYDGETMVTFSVTYQDEAVNALLSAPISGTLTLEEVEDVLLVRNVILK